MTLHSGVKDALSVQNPYGDGYSYSIWYGARSSSNTAFRSCYAFDYTDGNITLYKINSSGSATSLGGCVSADGGAGIKCVGSSIQITNMAGTVILSATDTTYGSAGYWFPDQYTPSTDWTWTSYDSAGTKYAAAGSVAGTSGLSGAVTARLPSAGSVAALSSLSPLSVLAWLAAAGTVGGSSTVSDLATLARLVASGSADAQSSTLATIQALLGVSGAVSAVSDTYGALLNAYNAAGVSVAISDASGTITALRPAAGSVGAVTSIPTALINILKIFAVTGTATVVSTFGGDATKLTSVTAPKAAAVSTVSGAAGRGKSAAGSVSASSATLGAITARAVASGQIAVISDAFGGFTVLMPAEGVVNAEAVASIITEHYSPYLESHPAGVMFIDQSSGAATWLVADDSTQPEWRMAEAPATAWQT